MKKKQLIIFGFAVLFLAAIFTTIGCPGGGDDPIIPPPPTEKLQSKNLTIAGSFDSPEGQAKFYATAGSGSSAMSSMQSVRSITSTSFALEGYLEDGDFTFRLRGSYNSDSRTYTLSAASSILRYSISGDFKTDGTADSGKAVIQVKDGPEWKTFEVEIEVESSVPEINTSGPIVDETAGGIPMNMRGIWRDFNDASFYAMVNAFSIVIYEKVGNTWVEMKDHEGNSMAMYFTDITTVSGVTSGVNAFMGWDWDAIAEHDNMYWFKVFNAYLAANPTLVYEDTQLVLAKFSLTSQAQTIMNKYPTLSRRYEWAYPRSSNMDPSWFETTYNEVAGAFWEWLEAQTIHGLDLTNTSYESTTQYRDAMLTWRNGPGKALCDLHKFEVICRIMPPYTIHPDYGYPEYNYSSNTFRNAENEIWNGMEKWAKNQGIVTENEVRNGMYESGFEDIWLTNTYGKDSIFYCQFYAKMALKLQQGRLYWGQYIKPPVGGMFIDGSWWSNDPDDIPPEWVVKDYSNINILSQLEWMDFGLRR